MAWGGECSTSTHRVPGSIPGRGGEKSAKNVNKVHLRVDETVQWGGSVRP